MAAVAMIAALLVTMMIIVGMVLGGSRDHELTVRRAETVRAIYAAEAGMNMAIREISLGSDEDGDGGIGTVSDDGNDANNPSFGMASFVVTSSTSGGTTTLTSTGSAGESRREFEAVTE
jgi:hypothetical protein